MGAGSTHQGTGHRPSSSGVRFFLSHSSFHHLVFEQTAFEGAVVERGAFGRGEADELGQSHVAAEQVGTPAAELLLQYVAELWVKLRQCLLLAKTNTVRRVSDDDTLLCRGGDVQDVGPLKTHDFL